MRLNTAAISAIAMLATAVSGQHTVNCWGKALHADIKMFPEAISFIEHGPPIITVNPNGCKGLFCKNGMSVRFCTDSDKPHTMGKKNIADSVRVLSNECRDEYKGKTVAGGVVDHPDHWSVVVQGEDDLCKPLS